MKKKTRFLAILLIASMLAGNFSGYAVMPQIMNVQAETLAPTEAPTEAPTLIPTIPTTLGTELFVETFDSEENCQLSATTHKGCTATFKDGYLLYE